MSNGYVNVSGEIKSSCISCVRGTNYGQTCKTTSTMSVNDSKNFYTTKASMPNKPSGSETSLTDFYCSSVTTAYITTVSETWSTYKNNNNGYICASFVCDSIVTKNGKKVYNFNLNGSTWVEKVENTSVPNVTCRTLCRTGLNSGTYTVQLQDGLTSSTPPVGLVDRICKTVTVGYNDNNRIYVAQRDQLGLL